MIRPAAVVLIVLCALAQAFPDREVVLAEFDDSAWLLGYNVRFQFKLELVQAEGQDVDAHAEPVDFVVRDTVVVP